MSPGRSRGRDGSFGDDDGWAQGEEGRAVPPREDSPQLTPPEQGKGLPSSGPAQRAPLDPALDANASGDPAWDAGGASADLFPSALAREEEYYARGA